MCSRQEIPKTVDIDITETVDVDITITVYVDVPITIFVTITEVSMLRPLISCGLGSWMTQC